MSALVPFTFEGADVRVFDRGGEPWFVAKDVAIVLGYANPQDAVRRHCKAARQVGGAGFAHPLNLDPQTTIIPERDVYRLIMRSNLPSAERFEEWIVGEVLPSIRRTGGYLVEVPSPTALGLPDFTDPVASARAWADEREGRQIAVAALEAAKPKLDAYDHFLGSRSEGMNLQRAMKAISVGPNRGIAALRADGVLFGTPATPKQCFCERGYFEVKPIEGTDGKVRPQTLVTPKGLDWLRGRLSSLVEH